MSDGLQIRFREVMPDRKLLELARDELSALHHQWPDTVDCNIVIAPALVTPLGPQVAARIKLDLGRRCAVMHAESECGDAYLALRSAFQALRDGMLQHAS